MQNVLILGSGRSGTSMLSGCLANAGYFMGDNLVRASEANPKGFFEDVEVNGLNEELLLPLLPRRMPVLGRWLHRQRPRRRQLWLAELPVGTEVPCPPALAPRLEAFTRRQPFCYKDPRFCLTLPAWRPFLEDASLERTEFLVVFRHPVQTARSILKECQRARYLSDLSLDLAGAVRGWTCLYRHILDVHRHVGSWTFLHFEQILEGSGLDRVEAVTGARVDRSFPDAKLRRSRADLPAEPEAERRYRELCALADFDPDAQGGAP